MYYDVFLSIFSIILFVCVIISLKKKTYLYLFFVALLFLPEYYGIEFSENLPLLTVTRILYLVFYLYALINRKRCITVSLSMLKSISHEYYFLLGYFVLRIVSNLYYAFTYSQAINTIFRIIFEQLFLLISIWMLAPTKEDIKKLVKVIVWAASLMFILGIAESLSGYRITNFLYTVRRSMSNDHYFRLGLLRSTVTMGLPNFYGNMCILVLPLILYLYELEKKNIYILMMCLDLMAVIHSGCRSDMFFFFIILLAHIVLARNNKSLRLAAYKAYGYMFLFVAIAMIVLSLSNPYYKYFYIGTGKSLLNEMGFDYDLDKGAPAEGIEYGANADGTGSRLTQLTGIKYVAKKNPVFGLGSGAQNRHEIEYLWYGKPNTLKTYDTGILEIFCDEGIIGLIGIFCLLLYLYTRSKNDMYYRLSVITFLLSTLSTTHMFTFCFLYIVIWDLNLPSSNSRIMEY